MISRRQFAWNAALWAAGFHASATRAATVPKFITDPFRLGVASGDPLADGFILWTRLAPEPFEPRALPSEAIPVTWEVGHDSALTMIAASGEALAQPHLAHSVHVDVRGLEANRVYYYRFRCGGVASPVGRAKTLPKPGAALDKLRFAFACCQHYEQGYFTAYRDMVAQNPDLILHLGDYIYEVSQGLTIRSAPVPEARTLAEYRLLHAAYKLEPDLQAAHAHCPWLMLWDDHEFANDYTRDEAERERAAPSFRARRAAAYQAYYEHMPVRTKPAADGSMVKYQHVAFGNLADFACVDTRQYRDRIACQPPGWRAGRLVEASDCPEIASPRRSLLGAEQERWLDASWAKSGARWNVLAQSMMLAGFDQHPGPANGVFNDGWNGYAASRQKLIDLVKRRTASGAANFVALGGDIHGYFMSDVKENIHAPSPTPILMSEFVTTSVTSQSNNTARFQNALPDNPHIKFLEDRVRGYTLCDVDAASWRATLRGVENVFVPTPQFRTVGTFALESGRPGIQVG